MGSNLMLASVTLAIGLPTRFERGQDSIKPSLSVTKIYLNGSGSESDASRYQREPQTLASTREFRCHVPIATMPTGMEAISQGVQGSTESIIALEDLL